MLFLSVPWIPILFNSAIQIILFMVDLFEALNLAFGFGLYKDDFIRVWIIRDFYFADALSFTATLFLFLCIPLYLLGEARDYILLTSRLLAKFDYAKITYTDIISFSFLFENYISYREFEIEIIYKKSSTKFKTSNLNPLLSLSRRGFTTSAKNCIIFVPNVNNEEPSTEETQSTKSLWKNSVLSHILDLQFIEQFNDLIKNLTPGKAYSCIVTVFGGDGYYSLGPQMMVTNKANIELLNKNLLFQYELLANRYNLANTDKTLVRLRELTGVDPKVDEFLFKKMRTDPFQNPGAISESLVDELFFPFLDLSKIEDAKINYLTILRVSPSAVQFIWNKHNEAFFVEFDKVSRKGVAYNANNNIQFEDTPIGDCISRNVCGFKIQFNPNTQKFINYTYDSSVENVIKPTKADNPRAFTELQEAQLFLKNQMENLNNKPLSKEIYDNEILPLTTENNFATLDIETLQNQNANVTNMKIISIGWFTVNKDGEKVERFYFRDDFESEQVMIVSAFKELEQTNIKYLYVHNWAGFDNYFLFKYLQPTYKCIPHEFDGKIYRLDLKTNSGTIQIKDSLYLLPMGLADLCKAFKVEDPKTHFPYRFNPVLHSPEKNLNYKGAIPTFEYFEGPNTSAEDYKILSQQYKNKDWDYISELKNYQMNDVRSLHQVLTQFSSNTYNNLGLDVHKSSSIPGLAFRLWRAVMNPRFFNSDQPIFDLPININNMLREAYFGGHVDVYKPMVQGDSNKPWYYYDVNSLYPAAMMKELPVGKPTYITNPTFNEDFFGFLNCTVTSPDNCHFPVLPVRKDEIVIFPEGRFSGTWFSEELRYAESLGYKIVKSHWGMTFQKSTKVFTTLIKKLNQMKITATTTQNSPLRTISKLFMNSLYGRFGLRYLDQSCNIYSKDEASRIHLLFEISRTVPFEDGSEMIIHKATPSMEAIEVHDPNSEELNLLKEAANHLLGTNVAIASAITAHSRVMINNYKYYVKNQDGEVAYSDTDSLVTNVELPASMIDATTLGLMKLEHKIQLGYFVAPKLYYLKDLEGNEISKSRGYKGQISLEHFIDLYKGSSVTFNIDKWYRLPKEHRVEIRNIQLTLSSTINKREKIFNDSGDWIDTKSITLTDSIPEAQIIPIPEKVDGFTGRIQISFNESALSKQLALAESENQMLKTRLQAVSYRESLKTRDLTGYSELVESKKKVEHTNQVVLSELAETKMELKRLQAQYAKSAMDWAKEHDQEMKAILEESSAQLKQTQSEYNASHKETTEMYTKLMDSIITENQSLKDSMDTRLLKLESQYEAHLDILTQEREDAQLQADLQLEALQEQNTELRAQNAELRAQNARLESKLDKLISLMTEK